MKTHLQIWILTAFFLATTTQSTIAQSQVEKLNLVVSNVCDYYGQYVVTNGPASSSVTPSLGNAGCVNSSVYAHYDSLQILGEAKFLEVTDDGPNPDRLKFFYVANENMILSYQGTFPTSYCDPIIYPRDTFLLDSISGMSASPNRLWVIREASSTNNFLVFDTLSTTPIFSINLAMTPKFIEYNYAFVTIVGTGSNNETILKTFDAGTMLQEEDTVLSAMGDNPISILCPGSQIIFVASQPGDTTLNMTSFNLFNNTITSANMFSGSGAHAYAWDGNYFHFQPESDPSGNNYDWQIIKYDPTAMQQYAVFNLNQRFHKLIYAGGGGFSYYAYMHCVLESAINNMVLIYTHYNYMQVDSFQADYQVDLIASDFRCPMSMAEYDDSKIKILAFPNPAGNSITINASGLICGRDYKMDFIDMSGKVWYEKTIHAKMSVEIPLEAMPSGMYILRIHTLQGMVTEKIVKK